MEKLTLRELCIRCGVSRRAVQGYEKYNLVSASGKTDRGYLLYDGEAVEKVGKIKSLQNYGFTVKEIAGYIHTDEEERKTILRGKLEGLYKRRRELDGYIEEVTKLINE